MDGKRGFSEKGMLVGTHHGGTNVRISALDLSTGDLL